MNSISWDWKGKQFRVKILYSYAGVATQILVNDIKKENNILMDAGDGILRDLLSLPRKYHEKIQTILITHGHFDHVGGLYSLLCFYRMLNRKEKLTIICPKAVTELQGLMRTFQESYADSIPFSLDVREIDSKILIDNTIITPFPVQHRGSIIGGGELPDVPTLGYIINKNEEKIVYTGDTGYFEKLKTYLSNADFAILEGTNREKGSTFHLSIPEAERLGKLAKNHLIIHKIPNFKD
jgi:ribonuclease BN (tRNA processing enzyme)